MDTHETLLDLSDVVHEPDDGFDDVTSTTNSPPDELTELTSGAHTDHADEVEEDDDDRLNTEQDVLSFTVEMLEREIATLLHQNAPTSSTSGVAASDPEDLAHCGDIDDRYPENPAEVMHQLGLNLGGIAAVLHAAQVQSARSGRTLEDGREEKDTNYSQEKASGLRHVQSTKSTPAFQSLTADHSYSRQVNDTMAADSYYASSGESEMQDEEDNYGMRKASTTADPLDVLNHDTAVSLAASQNLDDISVFLANLTSDLDHEPVASSSAHASNSIHSQDHLPHSTQVFHLEDPTSPSSIGQPVQETGYYSSQDAMSSPNVEKRSSQRKGKGRESGPTIHPCGFCTKTFGRRSDMLRHARIHTGERPFPCAHVGCGKTFIQRSALHVHLRVHTGERPHACEYPGCGKSFSDSSSLARHRRTHTGKRPYRCEDPECDKTFTRRTTLTTHMRTHDPTWEPDPNIRYSFKAKKRKVDENDDDEDRELEESVRTLSTLFNRERQGEDYGRSPSEDPGTSGGGLDMRVAEISAEIASAIAQAQSRLLEEEEEEEEEEDESGPDRGPGVVRQAWDSVNERQNSAGYVLDESQDERDRPAYEVDDHSGARRVVDEGSDETIPAGSKRKR